MFLGWLRFTVRLLVYTKAAVDPAEAVRKHNLALPRLQLDPHQAHAAELLERDYQILRSLVARVPNQRLECILLRADFRLLQIWSLVLRPFAPLLFRSARVEMVAILENLACRVAAQS